MLVSDQLIGNKHTTVHTAKDTATMKHSTLVVIALAVLVFVLVIHEPETKHSTHPAQATGQKVKTFGWIMGQDHERFFVPIPLEAPPNINGFTLRPIGG